MAAEARIVIIPGNGCGDVEDANWYSWLRDELTKDGYDVKLLSMPDSICAREKYWIPFMQDELKCDEHTVIVGHSSGAVASIRYAENHKVLGIIMVSAYDSHLGDETEMKSGYFNRPWRWDKMKSNVKFAVQYGSTDDPFLPWETQQAVADGSGAKLLKFSDRGHFMTGTFPELVTTVKEEIKSVSSS